MKKKYEKIYNKLAQSYTDEEIVDAMLIPADLSEEEERQAQTALKKYRMERLATMSEQQRLLSSLMQLRFQIESYLRRCWCPHQRPQSSVRTATMAGEYNMKTNQDQRKKQDKA